MRAFFAAIIMVILSTGCNSLRYQEVIQTGVSGTQLALAASTSTATIAPIPTKAISTIEPMPENTATVFVPPETLLPTDNSIIYAQIGQQASCGNSLIANVPSAPEFNKDLFEHHAEGTFLMVKLELINTASQPIQIWDGDYSIEGTVNGILKSANPHRAATTYLFIQRGGKLMQDQVDPGVMNWETNLAFDVNPAGENWVLVFRPGLEGGQALCEIRFNLTSSG